MRQPWPTAVASPVRAWCNLPRARLIELGLTGGLFGKVLRSSSHEESIRMVADGRAEASFVEAVGFQTLQ